MTLASLIDILSATMLGRTPCFTDTYREKHLSSQIWGLCELTGCEDRMMYMISEIACLDALDLRGALDSSQMGPTELAPPTRGSNADYAITAVGEGKIRPRVLACKITARTYLMSLIPGSTRYNPAICDLVQQFAELLELVSAGPEWFDRSIVWPLLIAGAQSTAGIAFRAVFAKRVKQQGEQAKFGSFGRMTRLLEAWRLQDEGAEEEGRSVHWRD